MARFSSQLMLVVLLTGLVFALMRLHAVTDGSLSALAAAGGVVVCLGIRTISGDAWRASVLTGAVAVSVLLMLIVSFSGAESSVVGSSLCWSVITLCILAGLGIMSLPRAEESEFRSAHNVMQPVMQPVSIMSPAPLVPVADQSISWGDSASPGSSELLPDELDEGEILDVPPIQSWSRVRTGDEDRLEGTLVVDMAPGQRHCYEHVPFQPFFAVRPDAYCECDDDDFRAEVDVIAPYGARVNVRRRGDLSQPASARVMLVFIVEQVASRAA